MKFDYIVILAIMAVASYFLFIRKPKAKPSADVETDRSNPDPDAS
jgi:hypothetical protein